MVSKKRLDYGLDVFRTPIIPRAPRSIRRRPPHKNSLEDSELCAFELLAAVAGKLLQESESSASSNVASGGKDKRAVSKNGNEMGPLPIDNKALKSESFDHGSCAESVFVPEISIQEQNLVASFKGQPQSENDSNLEHIPEPMISHDLKKASDEKCQIGDMSMDKTSNVKEPNEECVNSNNMLINSDCSVQLPLYRELVANAFMQKRLTDVNLGIRDDDENSYGRKKLSTKIIRPFKPQPRMQHRRIRKMLTSKYRKVAPKLRGYELYNTSEGMKSFYQYRKRIYTRERCQQAPIKKRKLMDHRFSVAAYDQEASSDSISNLPEKGKRTASGTVKAHQKAKDTHVKFSIKSFKVPELYIEVPESASVGSLKRAVMEAVTAIIGSGMRVGVVLQGKKVRDDNRTLQQAGISQNSNLDTLGFSLEPCFTQFSPSKTAKKPSLVLPCEENQELPGSHATPMIDSVVSDGTVNPPPVTKFDDDDVNDGLISSPQTPTKEALMDGGASVPDSKSALVAVPPMNVGPLAVVPVNSKPKRSEISQRRTRRPFSVTEVEALVGAVEKLGTGRWRDVKIGAFENADHRTYVDLKDKWKTLVHTASISPHQRRGEPVPQELLDRVLAAHSYWLLHQSKHHGKQSVESLKSGDEEMVGACGRIGSTCDRGDV